MGVHPSLTLAVEGFLGPPVLVVVTGLSSVPSAGWLRLVSEPCLPQPSFGLCKPEYQDLLLSPALVRGCTSAGTRPVASMVRPPERTDAARSHDFGNEVSQPPDVLRSAARPAAGLGWATLGYPSAAMALGWAKELAPQPLPLGYHVEKCRSEVKPSGESGACVVGGNLVGPASPRHNSAGVQWAAPACGKRQA